MSPGMLRFSIIIIYLGALLGLSFFSSRLSRGTKSDYLLASHSIGLRLPRRLVLGAVQDKELLARRPRAARVRTPY